MLPHDRNDGRIIYVMWDAMLSCVVDQAVDEKMQIELMYLLVRSMRCLKNSENMWTENAALIRDQTLDSILTVN